VAETTVKVTTSDKKEDNIEVMSSCSSVAQKSSTILDQNAENGKNNQFNAFANSFHLADNVRASMSMPKLTEDMLKINEDLESMCCPTTEQLKEEALDTTSVQATEKTIEAAPGTA
jgi:hypothetical protein